MSDPPVLFSPRWWRLLALILRERLRMSSTDRARARRFWSALGVLAVVLGGGYALASSTGPPPPPVVPTPPPVLTLPQVAPVMPTLYPARPLKRPGR